MTSLRAEQLWLERIATSKLIGVCMIDDDGHLLQRFDDDPQLQELLLEHQRQRIQEMDRAVAAVAPVFAEVFSPDGSGGQAGDDASLAEGISRLAKAAPSPFNNASPPEPHG